jgi:hypothetical protein
VLHQHWLQNSGPILCLRRALQQLLTWLLR